MLVFVAIVISASCYDVWKSSDMTFAPHRTYKVALKEMLGAKSYAQGMQHAEDLNSSVNSNR